MAQPVGGKQLSDYHDTASIRFLGEAEGDVERNEEVLEEERSTVTSLLTQGASGRQTDYLPLQSGLATCSLCSYAKRV